jgi:hypothetical protein
MDEAARLNGDCHAAQIDRAALDAALGTQGDEFYDVVKLGRPHLFAGNAFFISAAQMEQMRAVITAAEEVVATSGWRERALKSASPNTHVPRAKGVFFGYDFHVNAEGAHLIEINTNAGGAYLNALLLQSQRQVGMPGLAAAPQDLEQTLIEMFRSEWRLERGDAPLQTIAIVDEQPLQQYLYPEFLLAQWDFEHAGISVVVADPSELELRGEGLYCRERRIDLVYNRLTDFSLEQHSALAAAYRANQVVVTPHPQAYALYADKRNLARLTDVDALRAIGVAEATIATLAAGIPQTRIMHAGERDQWWSDRKHWFFKPATGYGAKGSYRGAGITRRVFEEIMQHDYVAQKLAAPGERMMCVDGAEAAPFKSDVRCYVYAGKVQLVAARLYQGQTTNFRTPGGGFAPVRIV